MDSIIKIFALPIGLLFAVKIAGILFTKYPYIPVLAFVAFVIYACIVGPPPPPPPPPKGTGVQRMWIGIHQDQLEALEREREELLEEIKQSSAQYCLVYLCLLTREWDIHSHLVE